MAWDAPAHYGVACKRVDLRDPDDRSAVQRAGAACPARCAACVKLVDAAVVVVSYNDESWVSLDELVEMCAARGPVTVLSFDSRRYVGATIGIHNPAGQKVGTVSHTRNTEYVLVAGDLSADAAPAAAPAGGRYRDARGAP